MAGSAWTNQVQNLVIVAGPTGTIAGVFVYSGTPSSSNPPIAWISASTKDPFGSAIQPGVMLAELKTSGNALGGFIWNTAVPGTAEPLVALYPDATVGFTGNSPFMLGRVFNRAAANELLAMAFGGGGTAGSSPVMMEMFSQSKDGTVLGHVSFYDWASTNLICDVNVNGIVAANPTSANTLETFHNVTGDAGWSAVAGYAAMKYKADALGNVQFTGAAQHTSLTTTTAINSSNPLASAYRPVTNKVLAAGNSPLNRLMVEYRTDGILYALANASAPGTIAEVDATIPLSDT